MYENTQQRVPSFIITTQTVEISKILFKSRSVSFMKLIGPLESDNFWEIRGSINKAKPWRLDKMVRKLAITSQRVRSLTM